MDIHDSYPQILEHLREDWWEWGAMSDHETHGCSLILKGLENLALPKKGALVAASETMLLGKTNLERL